LTDTLLRSLRAATRSLRRSPYPTAAAIAIVALGVGATTAAFSVIRGVLVHSVPYPQAEELVQVTSTIPAQPGSRALVALPRFEAYLAESRQFASLVAYATQDFTVTDGPTPVSLSGVRVTQGFFRTTGIAPLTGREFSDDEQLRGGARAVMIGERFWRGRFGAQEITGKTIAINGEAVPIVGVVPAAVAPPLQKVDLWLPRVYETDILPPPQIEGGGGFLRVTGRLNAGGSVDAARAELQQISDGYRQRFGSNRDIAFDANVWTLPEYLFGEVRGTIVFTWAAGVLVFLLACANAGNVLLARYITRRAELDTRAAVGASRSDIVLQLLSEAAVIGVAAMVAGLILALVLLSTIAPLASRVLSTATPYALDWTVFAVAAALAVVATAITGFVPALQATSGHRGESTATGARSVTQGRAASRWRRGFVATQVALSYLLLAGAFQQASALLRLDRLDRGFDLGGLTAFRVAPSVKYPTPESRVEYYRQLEERIGRLPGIEGVGASQAMPVGDDQTIAFAKEADQAKKREEWPVVQFRIVTPGYFGALGTKMLFGRGFTAADAKEAPPVTVINAALAKQHFGDANPIGQRIFLGSFPGAREVVGVVTDVRHRWLETAATPHAYIPVAQLPVRMPPAMYLARTSAPAGTIVPALRAAVAEIDADQSLTRVRTMDDAAAEGLAIPRMRGFVTVGFAVVGMLLAAVGLWSVVSQYVADRTREVAIRAALGADPGEAARGVTRVVSMMTGIGIVVGLGATLALGRVAQRMISGLEQPGVTMLLAAAVPLALVALITARVQARRAERVEPAVALRAD
jgi:putative ABC transport system permease protein